MTKTKIRSVPLSSMKVASGACAWEIWHLSAPIPINGVSAFATPKLMKQTGVFRSA